MAKKRRKKKPQQKKKQPAMPEATAAQSAQMAKGVFNMLASHESEWMQLQKHLARHVDGATEAIRETQAGQEVLKAYFWDTMKKYVFTRSLPDTEPQKKMARQVFKSTLMHLYGSVPAFGQHVMLVYRRIRQNSDQLAQIYQKAVTGQPMMIPKETEEEINAKEYRPEDHGHDQA